MSRFFTSSAFSSMNLRRASTSSPMRVEKMSSVAAMSSSFTCSSVRRGGVHGGLPELRCGHFAEALVALHLVLLAALLDDVVAHFARGLLLDRVLGRLGVALAG